MNFCPNDGMLMYFKCHEQTVHYECPKCKFTKQYEDNCIARKQYNNSMDDFAKLLVNPYTIYDPTLPERKMNCLNSKCDSLSMIFYRHDPVNMRHLFICKKCLQVWTYCNTENKIADCEPRYLFDLEKIDDDSDNENMLE
tara:strand:+ start:2437 stop:2856 length:420 start_codon:yes stop_codon:yes gene_type:complete